MSQMIAFVFIPNRHKIYYSNLNKQFSSIPYTQPLPLHFGRVVETLASIYMPNGYARRHGETQIVDFFKPISIISRTPVIPILT